MRVQTPVTWFGGQSRRAAWIAGHFPGHFLYCEPFGGSVAVLLSKSAAPVEVYNDLDGDLVNLFQVLRDERMFRRLLEAVRATLYACGEFKLALEAAEDPVEASRRFLVRQRQSHGGFGRHWSVATDSLNGDAPSTVRRWLAGLESLPLVHARLRRVQIDQVDWREALRRYDRPAALFYLDPPYLQDSLVNVNGGGRVQGLTDGDQRELLTCLQEIKGMAVISGYRNDIYDCLTEWGWRRVDFESLSYTSPTRARRVESLWLSPRLLARREREGLMRSGQLSLFAPTLRDRRREGARLTHQRRVERTEGLILSSISELNRTGIVPTRKLVSEMTGISREHLSRRYGRLFADL